MRTLDPSRTPEYRAVMTVIAGACTLAALGSIVPAVDYAANVGVVGLIVMAVLAAALRWLARFVRERIEDASDRRTAAAWQAAHRHHRAARERTTAGVS